MPLDRNLMRASLRLPCPHCGHVIERTGEVFAKARLRCASCGQAIKLGYSEKLELFKQAARESPLRQDV